MKKSFFISLLFIQLLSTAANAQKAPQGTYAGAFKKLIGKTFTDERHIAALPGYTFRQGDLISDVNDPNPMTLIVLVKGTSAVVLFSAMVDTTTKTYSIIDVINITNIPKGWEIKTSGCQFEEADQEIIVALVKPGKQEYTRVIKQAWLCSSDILRFQAIGTKNIKCLNEGQD